MEVTEIILEVVRDIKKDIGEIKTNYVTKDICNQKCENKEVPVKKIIAIGGIITTLCGFIIALVKIL